MAEVAQYAALLDLGRPDFIEIKGVTYCGSSDASSLTMGNVPYHEVGERGGGLELGVEGAGGKGMGVPNGGAGWSLESEGCGMCSG
jgi:hypothetical protein